MGFKSIIALMMCFALVLTLSSSFGSNNPIDKVKTSAESIKITQANLTVGIGGINFGSTSYPDVFAIFSGLANLFSSIGNLITDVFVPMNSLPGPVYGFLVALLLILFAISVVGWWKGTESG